MRDEIQWWFGVGGIVLGLLTGCQSSRISQFAKSDTSKLGVAKSAERMSSRQVVKSSTDVAEADDAPGFKRLSTVHVGPLQTRRPDTTPADSEDIVQVSSEDLDVGGETVARFQVPETPEAAARRRTHLEIPTALPGADAEPINLTAEGNQRSAEIEKIFGTLPDVDPTRVKDSIEGRHYSLNELQTLALTNNPVVAQAEAQITIMRGTAVQAGLHPNPVIGYEADTVGSGGTPNYHGGFASTVIKTPGKLELAESAANVDVWNAELMRKKTHIELITQVRGAYFAALIARENVKITEALVAFTDNVYRNQVEQLKGGLASTSESAQLRALAFQARTALVQSRNRHDAAWRQLVATVGVHDLPTGYLDGAADVLISSIDYETALSYMVANHTDVLAAQNSEVQARTNLRLQELNVTPDLQLYMALQKDYTTGPVYRATYNIQVGVPVPIFDRNQGNILGAHGTLLKTAREASRVQNDLAARLADAVERYENARNQTELYRNNILPDQARAFRGLYERRQQQPDQVGFVDVVNAQQTLLASINIYISTLSQRWSALTDVGALLQIETLEGIQALLDTGVPIEVIAPEGEDSPTMLPPSPDVRKE
ncbi:MAG: TolC family protein [Planctomycetes bacterium]|nr:TolC family protein [Planctomycetota bacterium]